MSVYSQVLRATVRAMVAPNKIVLMMDASNYKQNFWREGKQEIVIII
ncbi:hypothetical protein IQ238_15135 [Pleurocapsales cyanobacterium LEGE 06147]|nr:hypothetical protein [Pleurocapsales cyanobacterium LEGE 06147]